jgi:hypothetical protein
MIPEESERTGERRRRRSTSHPPVISIPFGGRSRSAQPIAGAEFGASLEGASPSVEEKE